MNSEVLNKARELGKAIRDSDEYNKLIYISDKFNEIEAKKKSCCDQIVDNEDTLKLTEEYSKVQKEFNNLMSNVNMIIGHMTKITVEKNMCDGCKSKGNLKK